MDGNGEKRERKTYGEDPTGEQPSWHGDYEEQ